MNDDKDIATGRARRAFLKTSASMAAAASALTVPSVFAANDTIKIGYISPRTGPFAPFAEADDFNLDQVRKSLASGLNIGGKTYKVEIVARDDQSSSDRASNLAAELINKEGVDLMLALGALTVVPVSQQCELNGVPCITTHTPWQAWLFPMKGDPSKGFKTAFHFFWGIEDISEVFLDIWKDLPTNKVVGSVFSNDLPGNVMGDVRTGMPMTIAKAGYKIVDIGKYQTNNDDYTSFIQAFKKADVEIVTGLFNPPEWASFVRQSAQLGFRPKVATIGKALLFRKGIEALGARADGMSTEIWWTPAFPFRSSITGQSGRQLADAFQAFTRREWTQPIGVSHALFEVGLSALKASANPRNPKAIADAIRQLRVETVIGRIDFAASPVKSVAKMRLVGGQWRTDANGKPDIFITNNGTAPEIPVERKFTLLKYT